MSWYFNGKGKQLREDLIVFFLKGAFKVTRNEEKDVSNEKK